MYCSYPGCDKQTNTLHHKRRQSHGKINDPWNLTPLCYEHHIRVHNKIKEAIELHLLIVKLNIDTTPFTVMEVYGEILSIPNELILDITDSRVVSDTNSFY
jgi:hypothetical protein